MYHFSPVFFSASRPYLKELAEKYGLSEKTIRRILYQVKP